MIHSQAQDMAFICKKINKRNGVTLCLFVFALKLCSQAIPQLDTLSLPNGLKIYLLQQGEDSVLNVRLVMHGGKKNETACQVGYSEVIQQLLSETLKEKQNPALKKRNKITCELRNGETLLSGNCSGRNFSSKMDLISTAILRLSFRHDKIHRAVSSIIDGYTPENISAQRLSDVYTDLAVYSANSPLGRNYCQYQVEKMLPEELSQFYFNYYTSKRASLLVCGSFNVSEVKKIITKRFAKWKPGHKEENVRSNDLKPARIKNREIVFINKRDAKHCLLTWVQSAPSSRSPDHPAFLVACNVFDHYLANKEKEKEKEDTLNFKPVSYTTDLMETTCIAGQNEMLNAVRLFDAALKAFTTLKFTETDLQEAVNNLKYKHASQASPESLLSCYDPLLYNFDSRKNYPGTLSGVTVSDVQLILKKYFNPDSYKLIIVGKENVASKQLELFGNVTHYQSPDFETCDESCVVRSKKKWKKGRRRCCFKCFMRGWCPCMYSAARLQ